jgi:nucleoside-diphosphate-sugar epimerase
VNVLEFCRKTGAGLTYVSSYLYGNPEYLPIDENHPVKAYNPYSHTKLVAEEICRYYREQFIPGISILRPFNVYGPGQSEQFLIPEVIRKVLDPGIPVIEVMDLRPKRDFVYVDDLADALYLSMDGPGGIYNVGSGSSVSVEEVVSILQDLTGSHKEVATRHAGRPMEIFDLYADCSKIEAMLKWKPKVRFREGLERCIGACRATKSNGQPG